MAESSDEPNMDYEDHFTFMHQMVHDALRLVVDIEQEDFNEEELSNSDAQRFYEMLISANQPIYEGSKVSKLSISMRLLAAQTNWHCP